MPPGANMLPPQMQMQMQMMGMHGGMAHHGRPSYHPRSSMQQPQQFMHPQGMPQFMQRPRGPPRPMPPMGHPGMRPIPPSSSQYGSPGRGRFSSGRSIRGRGSMPWSGRSGPPRPSSFRPHRGEEYYARPSAHGMQQGGWTPYHGIHTSPSVGKSRSEATKTEEKPDILNMTYEEYLQTYEKLKSNSNHEHSGQDDETSEHNRAPSEKATSSPEKTVDAPASRGAKQQLMTEEQYIAYCKKYTAEMGIPFDENQVKEHYSKMKAEYEASLNQKQDDAT